MEFIITEEQEELLINKILSESFDGEYPEKRLSIKKFLDDNFMRGSEPNTDKDGMPGKSEFVIMVSDDGKPIKSMTDRQLFDMVEYKFQGILPKEDRSQFIKDTIIAWYYRNINKNGNIVS